MPLPPPSERDVKPTTEREPHRVNLDLHKIADRTGAIFPMVRIGDPLFPGLELTFPKHEYAELRSIEEGELRLYFIKPGKNQRTSIRMDDYKAPDDTSDVTFIQTDTAYDGKRLKETKVIFKPEERITMTTIVTFMNG